MARRAFKKCKSAPKARRRKHEAAVPDAVMSDLLMREVWLLHYSPPSVEVCAEYGGPLSARVLCSRPFLEVWDGTVPGGTRGVRHASGEAASNKRLLLPVVFIPRCLIPGSTLYGNVGKCIDRFGTEYVYPNYRLHFRTEWK